MLCRHAGVCLVSDLPPWHSSRWEQLWHNSYMTPSPSETSHCFRESLTGTSQFCREETTCKRAVCLLSYTSFLPFSARTSLHTHLSPHTGHPSQLTVNASKVLPLTPSDLSSFFSARVTFVSSRRRNEALPGCVPQWDTMKTSFC